MRKVERLVFSILLFAMVCSFSSISTAASSAAYKKYVKTQLIPSIGKASKGVKKTTISGGGLGAWCKTKGIICVHTADLNNDKKKEALVVYLKNNVNQSDKKSYKALHIAVLGKKDGKVAMVQDITVFDYIDGGLKSDIRVYEKTYRKKKYIAIQVFYGIDGCGCSTSVLSMRANGKLAVKKAIHDPGYTSGIGLYRLSLSGVNNQLSASSYSKTLYNSERYSDAAESKTYGKRLQNEIKNYGLKVSVTKTYFGTKAWMIKKDSKMKLLCSIKAKMKYVNGKYKYTYVIR